jgi:deuterolysin
LELFSPTRTSHTVNSAFLAFYSLVSTLDNFDNMQTFTKLLAVASLPVIVSSAVLDIYKRDNALEVTLKAVDNAVVHATVKNVGAEDLNLLKYGTLFDSAPVRKIIVTESDNLVPFTGVLRSIQRTDLAPESFVSLAAGATFETTINTAEVHNLNSATYNFFAEGAIPFAPVNSTELTGEAIYFKSNLITQEVNGEAAAAVKSAVETSKTDKRTVLQSGCSSTQRSQTTQALAYARQLALAAQTAATSGSATKFSEYFKTTSSSTRSVVAARLGAVASQAGSLTSGATKYYCTDVYNYCESNVLAYTIPSTNEVVNCPLYYSALPALSGTCHAQDRATTSLHEFTHAPGTYSPGTADNAYGYSASVALTSARAVLNADSYALYANAIYVGC